jgi:hypothetical protein
MKEFMLCLGILYRPPVFEAIAGRAVSKVDHVKQQQKVPCLRFDGDMSSLRWYQHMISITGHTVGPMHLHR